MRITLLLICCMFLSGTVASAACNSSMPASTPDSQLLDNGDGTVSDLKTGLMWKKCMEGVSGSDCAAGSPDTFTWQQALEQPGIINDNGGFATHSDWRLPNIKELTSIVEEQCWNPAINLNRFPNTPSSYVWSGSPVASNSSYAWYVAFYGGYSSNYNRNDSFQVRLVRDGQ